MLEQKSLPLPIILDFLKQGYLLSPDAFDQISSETDVQSVISLFSTQIQKPTVLYPELFSVLLRTKQLPLLNWQEFEKARVLVEKGKNKKVYHTFLDILHYPLSERKQEVFDKLLVDLQHPDVFEVGAAEEVFTPNVTVLVSHEEDAKKREIQDFVSYFRARYTSLREILQQRQELQQVLSINRLFNKPAGEPVALIGLVFDKRITKNGNMLLSLEDPTGVFQVLINKDKPDLFAQAQYIVLDEVLGVTGLLGQNILFVNNFLFPDIPLSKEFKKAPTEAYAVFISDLHVGSKMFLEKDFQRFIEWINGQSGTAAQKEVSAKVQYLFIVGDICDGVGIYPEQDKELAIKDIREQYNMCARYLSQIRQDIRIILCPGNHDALRLAEPQPPLSKDLAQSLYALPNITFVSNPSWVNFHSSEQYPGFDVLLYHGYSFDFYIANLDALRLAGGYDRADLIMKLLLQKRHLAPSHTSTLYVPIKEQDPLVIHRVPDFFVSGHIHKSSVSIYNHVTNICCSCFQAKTAFQEKVGHNPEPSRVPVVNLRTREVKILNFGG